MVLKLIDICLNFISQNLNKIKNSKDFLTVTHKELLIQRLANHSQLYTNNIKSIIESLFTNNIKTIKFYKCDQINELNLKLISKNAQFQLKLLVICKCPNVTDEGLSSLIENQVNLEEICLKRLNPNNQYAQTFQKLKSSRLINVDLSYSSSFNDKDLINLCKNNPNIRSLSLNYCSLLTNEGLKSAFFYLKDLECLDIEGVKGLNEVPLIRFKNLLKLRLYGSNELNLNSLKNLFVNCNKLKELHILYSLGTSNSFNQTQDGVNSTIENNNALLYLPETLECLALFRPSISNTQILVNSLKRLVNLKSLSLHCVECINDSALNEILEEIGENLLILDLSGYIALPNLLTDKSIKSIAKYCKNLERLSLDLFSSTAKFDSLQQIFTSVDKRALKFKKISLSTCRSIEYDLLIQISINCAFLTHLDLSGLNDLIDDNLIEILASSNNSVLQYLDLKACTKLTDKSICLVVTKCPLICLVLAGINNLTDKCIFLIANHLQFTLKEIYLSGCTKITLVALTYLSDCCINHLICEHKVPNLDPNQLMAKNLDTGFYERVDQFRFS